MATSIVDALVITLGIDTSNYDKGQKRVSSGFKKTRDDAGDTAKFLEAQGKRASGFFTSIRNEILALAGVSLTAAGLTSFVKNTTQGLMQLSIQSQALGMSARALDGWGKAAAEAGSSAEKITGTLSNFQSALQNLKYNGIADSPIFQSVLPMLTADTGVKFDLNQDAEGLLRSVLGALAKEKDPGRARVIAQMAGIDDAILQQNQKGKFLPAVDRYTRQSGITDQDTKNAREFNRQMTEISQKFETVGYVIFHSLTPYIDTFLKYLNELATWISTHPKEIQKAFKDIGDTISDAAKAANDAAEFVGGWKNAILLLIGASVGVKLLAFLKTFTGALSGLAGIRLPQWLLIAAGLDAYHQVGNAEEEARKQGKTTGQYLVDEMKRRDAANSSSGNTFSDRISEWVSRNVPSIWNSGSGMGNMYGNVPGKGGSALLGFMSGQFGQLEAKYGLPAGLLQSVAMVESSGNPYAKSRAGAQGLFQFMPRTAKQLGINPMDPSQAAQGAARYLSQLLSQTGGNLEDALYAYNWGIGNLRRKGIGAAPAETRNYAPKVLAGMQTGAALTYRGSASPAMPGGTQYNFGTVNISSPAQSIDPLALDLKKVADTKTRVMGYTSGQN